MAELGTAEKIMDAAERRIREGGYNGFSFRDLATEIGIKSASVHHHFPTKGGLAAAVARRYADRFMTVVGGGTAARATASSYRAAFRAALAEDGRMCLCGALAAEAGTLPAEVTAQARLFFERCIAHLAASEMGRGRALTVMATLEGAMLLARALDDPAAFDEATSGLA